MPGQAGDELELSRGLQAVLLYLEPLLCQLTAVTAGHTDMCPQVRLGYGKGEPDTLSENSSSNLQYCGSSAAVTTLEAAILSSQSRVL